MKRYITLFAFISFVTFTAMAEGYRLLSGERLSNNQINSIAQDVRGFIWLGTDNGLNRYDGQNVTQYTRIYGDSTSLANNTVRCITPCADGSLWVGLANGMQRFCPRDDNFHNITFPDGIKPNVTCILNLRSGDVVIGTSGFGLFLMKDDKRYNATRWDAVNEKVPCRHISYLAEDSQGRLWIGSVYNSCHVYDLKGEKAWRALPEGPVGSINYIGEGPSGRVVVTTHGSIYSCGRSEQVCHEELAVGPTRDIISVAINNEGQLMAVLRGEGLMWYNRQEHSLTPQWPLGPSASRLKRTLHRAFIDRSGGLWLISPTMGVAMVPAPGQAFSHWQREDYDTALDGMPYVIHPKGDGNIEVCYETGAMATFDTEGHCLEYHMMPHTVRSMHQGSDGRLWLGYYYNGLGCMDPKTGKITQLPDDRAACINGISEDTDGILWYSPFGEGFRRLDPNTGEVTRYEAKDSTLRLSNNWVNHLCCDNKGRVWLAHCEGIACFDPTVGHCLPLDNANDLPFTFGHYIYVAHNGTVWAGTDNGVISISSDLATVHHYTTEQGLCYDNISAICEDGEGNIWVSTVKGLSRITPGETPVITRYYAGDGLVDRQYIRSVAAFDVAANRLYFGGTRGITSFCPLRIDSRRTIPDVRLMGLIVNNQPASALTTSGGRQVMTVAVTEAVEFYLGYEDNTFTMEFGVTNFASTEDISYEYSFDGQHWNATPEGQSRITFTHLASGTYPLMVRVVMGSDRSEAKQYIIHISAPWYASTPAWVIYALLFMALVGACVFVYLRDKQAELKESKLVFFTNISHEIRTPLTMIVSPLDKLLSRSDLDSEAHRSLQVMRQNAGRILTLMNQLLDIRKFDKGQMTLSCRRTDVAGFLDGLFHLFDEQARLRGITYTYERPEGAVEAWIDQSHIDKVTMNLLGNAFKFTPEGGAITLRLTTSDSQLAVSVTDTGIGLDPKDSKRIFQRFYRSQHADGQLGTGIGLHLSSELMRLHHGTLTGENRQDGIRGSIFTFTLPLGSEYLKEEEKTSPASPLMVEATEQSPATTALSPSLADGHGEKSGSSTAKGGHRIMIVDDDEEILSYLKSELQSHYRLILCRDGQEALNTALREQPAVIVSDVMMPVMDGCTMVRRLRSNANISHIPVILLSAKSEVEDRVAGLAQGADAYMPKPFNTDELLAMIHGLIEGRQRLRGVYSGQRDQTDRVENIEMQSSDEQLMDRLMKVVNQHLSDSEFNIEQLAQEVGLSRTHLHRKLKALTGLSASEFLRNLRMRQAEQLLKSKRMNISQIAYAVGFANQTHFSTAFKKHTGMSPSEYIEANMP